MLSGVAAPGQAGLATPDASAPENGASAAAFLGLLNAQAGNGRHGKGARAAALAGAKVPLAGESGSPKVSTDRNKAAVPIGKPEDAGKSEKVAKVETDTAVTTTATVRPVDAKAEPAMRKDAARAEAAAAATTALAVALPGTNEMVATPPLGIAPANVRTAEAGENRAPPHERAPRAAAKRDLPDAARAAKAEPRSEPVPSTAPEAATPRLVEGNAPPAPAAAKAPDPTPAHLLAAVRTQADPAAIEGAPSSGVTEARIPLAREAAPSAALAAPALMMRVHTKDGATKAIDIRLDPPGLGQVDVKLETDSAGRLRAVLSTENADAFELLKRESGALESALREAGVDLAEDGIAFTLNDGGRPGHGPDERSAAYDGATTRRETVLDDVASETAAVHAGRWRDGVIDISV